MTHPTEQPYGAHGECATDDLLDLDDLKSRINPGYAHTKGTESCERRLCVERIEQQAARIAELSASLDGAKTALQTVEALSSWGSSRQITAAEALATLHDVSAAVAAIEARALREAAAELKKVEVHHDSYAHKLLCKLAEQKERGA